MLHWQNGRFACRHCHDLRYTVQNMATVDRAFARADRAIEKVLALMMTTEAEKWRREARYFPPPPGKITHEKHDHLEAEFDANIRLAAELIIAGARRTAESVFGSLVASHQ